MIIALFRILVLIMVEQSYVKTLTPSSMALTRSQAYPTSGSSTFNSSASASRSSSAMSSSSLNTGGSGQTKPGPGAPPQKPINSPNITAAAERITPGAPDQSNLCVSAGVEGSASPAAIKQKQCLEAKAQEAKIMTAMKGKIAQKKDCTVKVNRRSMVCHTKKVMQDVVQKPKYSIAMINNVILLKIAGKPVLAEVVETLSYDVQEVNKPRETQLKEPEYEVEFNTIGGLVDQRGTPPTQEKPKNDPCSECLNQLNAQASTVEGGVDDCSYTCDDVGIKQFVDGGYFTVSKSEAKPGAEGKPKPKPKPAENAEEA